MLAVSFLGKKFSCDAQIEVPNEADGGGLKLNLRVHEMCKKYFKPHGPVLASLHVNVNSGRSNDITKCKELLAFLKEQVLPKTLKMVSLKRLKNIKTDEKKEGGNWLRCIWPGKKVKRKERNKSNSKYIQNTRGYSSDTESCTQKCQGLTSAGVNTSYQASKAGILATPRLVRPHFVRKINENKQLSFKGDGKNVSRDKVLGARQKERSNEEGPQWVQNESLDWHSYSNVSASDSFVGFYSLNKSTNDSSNYSEIAIGQENSLRMQGRSIEFERSSSLGLHRPTNNLPLQEVIHNNRNCVVERCGVQEQRLKKFAALYVGEMCEEVLSSCVQQRSKEFVEEYVANVIGSASHRVKQEKSKPQIVNCHFEEGENMITEKIEDPSFSKVWKYSNVFPDEMFASQQGYNCEMKDQGNYENSDSGEEVEVKDESDIQFEEFLEKKMVDSLELSGSKKPASFTSNSCEQPVDIDTLVRTDPSPLKNTHGYHAFNDELFADYAFTMAGKGNHASSEINSTSRNEVSSEHFDVNMMGITSQRKEEVQAEEGRKNGGESGLTDNAGLTLGDPSAVTKQESEDVNHQKGDNETASNASNAADIQGTTRDITPKGKVEDGIAGLFDNDSESCKPENAKSFEKSLGISSISGPQKLMKEDTDQHVRQKPPYKRASSESQASERKQWSPLQTINDDAFSFHSSALSCMAAPKYVRSSSCSVVSEDDVILESMLSHHRDVYDLLSRRTWIILHVHELWNGGRPMDAIKSCIDLTGMGDVDQDTPYTQVTSDYALFLNILQQLPSSCSMWSLDLFVLLLPKLKEFISSQHHTSHVEMACGIIHIVLKKVAVVIRRTSKTNKNKDKELKIKACTNELKEIKDMANGVLQAVRSVKTSNNEDPASMKMIVQELLLGLGTIFEQI